MHAQPWWTNQASMARQWPSSTNTQKNQEILFAELAQKYKECFVPNQKPAFAWPFRNGLVRTGTALPSVLENFRLAWVAGGIVFACVKVLAAKAREKASTLPKISLRERSRRLRRLTFVAPFLPTRLTCLALPEWPNQECGQILFKPRSTF